ncbi:unnamed protein product [Sphagnum jensenii]|uniref:Starch synthase catalytic domain-containing protein n=1 Tax=Sphagnum jensenii TaxID=128206 RepID=A0ABP1AN51_9BRYO
MDACMCFTPSNIPLSSPLGLQSCSRRYRVFRTRRFGGGRLLQQHGGSSSSREEGRHIIIRMSSEGEKGSSNSDRSTVLEESRKLLARQKELLQQIEERQRTYSDFTNKKDEYSEPPSAELNDLVEKAGKPVNVTPKKTTGLETSAPSSGRPLITAWPAPSTQKSGTRAPSSVKPFSPSSAAPSIAPPVNPFVGTPPTPAKADPASGSEIGQTARTEVGHERAPDVGDTNSVQAVASPPLAGPNVMNVIVVAAECAPWSKTGGLGDVVGALPKALSRRGHRVMVVAPRYSNYLDAWETGIHKRYNVSGQDLEVGYFHTYKDGVDFVFIDSPIFHAVASNIYGGSREEVLRRMILLCKAAVEVPWHIPCGGVCYGDGNLVFIANDWHTALLPVYLQAYYRDKGLMEFTRSVLVIHNMAHQGRGPMSDYAKLGLPEHYADKFRLFDPIGGEHMNVFMAGLITAHRIVTVSHGYAGECQTREGGWGLDGVIRDHNWKLRGVVNGIDDIEWNPKLDPCLQSDGYSNYSLETLATGKPACKAALQQELGLPVRSEVPLLGFIGRLDNQKGVDWIAGAMPWMMNQDLQLVMLGTGRKDLEEMLRHFEGCYRDKVRGWVGFSVKTAHRITAGADILMMPSRFEPCGLNQLYAMRYGTVPVVHSVGGLRDTVKPFDPFTDSGTGWTFDRPAVSGLTDALGNAIWTYRDFKKSWTGIQQRGMTQDLSWDNAAQQYEEVLLAAKYTW